ncbi:MAG: radical SAM family heme chaperone HemW [Bacteroides sp.]|nr:radical SAM family heme chaperone HemW [Prevotella sp.]MCM1407259.1 radical SAM family heme chaperone HemW [Treponema brennaborense]MCM1469747.1 radical SAM family heme chaperone HemW [Bacteroides sp.]
MMQTALYIHIPFCKSKCSYCDFFSEVLCAENAVPDSYIDALLAEYSYRSLLFDSADHQTVYLGGGTPSLLSRAQLKKLSRIWAGSREVTAECNPDDISPELLDVFAECGISRISAGIQILDDDALRLVRRRSAESSCLAALELLKSLWLPRAFSVDVMTGLPGVRKSVFADSLRRILSYNPQHVSLYALTLEEHTDLYHSVKNKNIPYSDDENDCQWISGRNILRKAGFRQYEVSNFSKPGYQCLHNLSYWRMLPYIGIGAGAAGTVGSFRYTNIRDAERYISFWNAAAHPKNQDDIPQETENLTEDVRRREFLMMEFRTEEGVSEEEYRARFGEPFTDEQLGVFSRWMKNRRLRREGGRYMLTPEGLLFLNTFLCELM